MSDIMKPEDLAKIADDLDMAKAKKAMEHMKVEEDEKASLHEAFMSRELHPDVKLRVNNAVRRAAEQGNRQLLVITFPASYCNGPGTANQQSGSGLAGVPRWLRQARL